MNARVHLAKGVQFTGRAGSFTIVQWAYNDGELKCMVERDGEREWLPYADIVGEAQASVPHPVEPTPFDLVRETRFPYLSEAERSDLLLLLSDVLEAMHGDPGGTIHSPRPSYTPRPQYDPTLTTFHQRVLSKVEEMRGRKNGHAASKTGLYEMRKALLEQGVEGLIHKSRFAALDVVSRLDKVYIDTAEKLAAELAAESRSTVSARTRMTLYRARLLAKGVDYNEVSKSALRKAMGAAAARTGIDKPASVRLSQASRPRGVHGRYVVTRPGEVVQVDVTDTNVMAWSPICGWVKVDAIVGIDAFDRRIRVCKLVPAPHTARDISLALAYMLLPATRLVPRGCGDHWWPGVPDTVEIPTDSPATNMHGTVREGRDIDTIVMDHGAQFDNRLVASVATRCGINTIFAAPRRGHQKGIVESFHNQLSLWAQEFAGSKGNRPQHRGKNVEGNALITVAELEASIQYRIEHFYHRAPHDGLRDPADPKRRISPDEAYALYIANGGAPNVMTRPWLALDFLPSKLVRAGDQGITLNGLRYDGPGLTGLRDRERGNHAPDLRVAYDPNDPTRIYVEAERGVWVCVRDYGTQTNAQIPLLASARETAWSTDTKGYTLLDEDLDLARAKRARDEADEYSLMVKRKLGRTFERMLMAERDRRALGIAMLAPDPKLDWDDRDQPQFVDPDNEHGSDVSELDVWREDIALASGVFEC